MRGPMLTSLWFPFGQLLFGLWLFGWLPAKPPLWLTEGAIVNPFIAYPDMARVIFLSLLTVCSIGPFIWIDTSLLRRRFPMRDLSAIMRLVLASRRGAMTFVVLALFFGITSWSVFGGVPLDSYFVRVTLVIVCSVLMIILLPPTAIVLASSSPVSGQLLETTARHLFPFRVVSLLDGKYLGPTMFADKNDNLRTILGHSWRTAIHRLVEITPLVIVDARSATPPVCEEIRYMLDARRVGKAIFIVNDDGSAPGLENCEVDTRHVTLVTCLAREVPRAIAGFKRTGAVMTIVRQHREAEPFLRDGAIIQLPNNLETINSGKYIIASRFKGFVIKRPTAYWYTVMQGAFGPRGHKLLRLQHERGQSPIRPPYEQERPSLLFSLMKRRFPDLAQNAQNKWHLHYCAICRLHHRKLKDIFSQSIPDSIFLYVESKGRPPEPAIFQQNVGSASLWEILDHESGELKDGWKQYRQTIAQLLKEYIERSDNEIDFNPKNFVFAPETHALYYVESKPPFLSTARTSNHNRSLLQETFRI